MIPFLLKRRFSPSSLFKNGEQGAWYDPSDLTTLYQDAAGTTPVTAVEQPVGLMLDKSGRGNHAFQATPGNRPTLSARVNLLTYSEQFDNAAWTRQANVNITANSIVAPDGTTTADTYASSSASVAVGTYQLQSGTNSTAYSSSIYIKAGNISTFRFGLTTNSETATAYYDFDVSAVTATSAAILGFTSTSATITSVGGGWYRCVVFGTTPASGVTQIGVFPRANAIGYVYVWGADLRQTNIGTSLPTYQRVLSGAAGVADYDTVGFPLYLKANGSSSAMQTNSIDFTATDKMTVVTGVRKLSDAAQGIVAELSATSASNNGTFTLSAPGGAAANFTYLSKGTTADTVTATTYTSPISGVISALSSISAPSNAIRVNGASISSNTNSEGTGVFGNYALYLFSRNGGTVNTYFNGHFYGAIIRGVQSTQTQIEQCERYLNNKIGNIY